MFIYLFEDGEIGKSIYGPTEIDLRYIEAGTLIVIDISDPTDPCFINEDNDLIELDETDIVDSGEGAYHTLPQENEEYGG